MRVNNKNEAFSKVDLEHFFQQTKDQDEENQELNTELFENALSLPLVKIRQCLVPRTEIEGADIHTSIEDLKQQFIKTQLSKLVIYDDSVDSILGYVHQIDLFKRDFGNFDLTRKDGDLNFQRLDKGSCRVFVPSSEASGNINSILVFHIKKKIFYPQFNLKKCVG